MGNGINPAGFKALKKLKKRAKQACTRDPKEGDFGKQRPLAAILSCADSRVIPEDIFCSVAGDIFVARVAGNVAGTNAIASLEFAVNQFGVPLIVVLGHRECGAVKAACSCLQGVKKPLTPSLYHLMSEILPGLEKEGSCCDLSKAIKKNAKYAAKVLAERGEFKVQPLIVSAYYDWQQKSRAEQVKWL